MSRFVIEPHFRLQEWVAVEKDYFRDEGLEFEFRAWFVRPMAAGQGPRVLSFLFSFHFCRVGARW